MDGVPPGGLANCCAVNDFLVSQGQPPGLLDQPLQTAIRNDRYKLVQFLHQDCADPGQFVPSEEFYEINEDRPVPLIDRENLDLLASGSIEALTLDQRRNYQRLGRHLTGWTKTVVVECPGDCNSDLIVDDLDVQGWTRFQGASSWFDFNLDGWTNGLDLDVIEANFGKRCRAGKTKG